MEKLAQPTLAKFSKLSLEKIHPVHFIEHPSYLTPTDVEQEFDLDGWRITAGNNWTLSVYISMFYVALIFTLQYVMKHRSPFKLTKTLTVWNAILAVFSTWAFLRTAPEFFYVLTGTNGFHNTVCKWTSHNKATAYWSWLLALSKLFELGDTIFVVLRKQNLLFLHWYHHITTFMTWWMMAEHYEPNQLWYVVMNSFIHSFMYSYYALKALGFKIPRNAAMLITIFQILQMAFGIIVNVYALNVMWFQGRESDCNRCFFGLKISFGIYVSYFILFCQFFYSSYFGSKKRFFSSGISNSNGSSKGSYGSSAAVTSYSNGNANAQKLESSSSANKNGFYGNGNGHSSNGYGNGFAQNGKKEH